MELKEDWNLFHRVQGHCEAPEDTVSLFLQVILGVIVYEY